ncbi:siderophore ABC transporter substrate-binding protein [Lysobacter sp. GX 14042]|uniref:siderophore ABC transporter substrate-binding protein n=1 Tax=Lysobacter sp. GX 14042 TaxID=2907155 RepID=UPI001F456942|nr:siderophore ABC transporter substrate-binding protein [Lysobacter sp. GX 14042]MCE7032931.1 siderophore ABC transporter substrate-binding protein [Lysobacter sp. GX 14042]
MNKKILILAALVLALAACSNPSPGEGTVTGSAGTPTETPATQGEAGPIPVTHRQGEIVLERQPQRVVVQDIAVLDILDALGVDAVIGVPARGLPDYLAQYGTEPYLKTGTLQEPDYEVISAAQPDLVILAGRSRTKFSEVSAIAPTIDLSVDNDNLVEGVKANVTTLGAIFGKQERAAELNAEIDGKFAALRERTADAGTAIVLVTNAGRLGVYGNDSRLSWIFTEAGFKPVRDEVDDRFHGGDAVSFEFILEADPAWIFVVDRDAGIGTSEGGAAQKLLDNALVHQTRAWKDGHIVYLDPVPAYVVMHGFTAVTRLADQVMEAVGAGS